MSIELMIADLFAKHADLQKQVVELQVAMGQLLEKTKEQIASTNLHVAQHDEFVAQQFKRINDDHGDFAGRITTIEDKLNKPLPTEIETKTASEEQANA